jgi:very-short-patch-repair endonuclease
VPTSWHQKAMGACLWSGEGSVTSHRAAAALWNFEGFTPKAVEISTPKKVRSRHSFLVVHTVRTLAPAEKTRVLGIPVTTPTRTLTDLAAVVDLDRVESALEDALRKGLTSLAKLRWTMENLARGRRGAVGLQKLLDERVSGEAPSASVLELRLSKLLSRSKLPRPVRQFEVRGGGKVVARLDFAYPDVLLAVEADGYRYHSGHSAWQKDLIRQNALMKRGWRVLRVTWEDLRLRPQEIIAEIEASLLISARFARLHAEGST